MQIGAVAFIHHFGASLNGQVHFHVCVVDRVFEVVSEQTKVQASNGKWTSWNQPFVAVRLRCTAGLRFAPVPTPNFAAGQQKTPLTAIFTGFQTAANISGREMLN